LILYLANGICIMWGRLLLLYRLLLFLSQIASAIWKLWVLFLLFYHLHSSGIKTVQTHLFRKYSDALALLIWSYISNKAPHFEWHHVRKTLIVFGPDCISRLKLMSNFLIFSHTMFGDPSWSTVEDIMLRTRFFLSLNPDCGYERGSYTWQLFCQEEYL